MLFACLMILLVLGLIVRFVLARKKSPRCLGCPFAESCEKKKNRG